MLDPWLPYVFCAFVVGSIPFGRLLGKRVAGIDITEHGSGNIGATNVARSLGLGWGLLTLLLDALKGWVPVLAFVHWGRPDDASLFNNPSWVGLWAILGHQFSPFQRLRGGKGVATALGVYVLVSPLSCVLGLLLFLFLVSRWGFVSLGSILAAWSIPGVLGVAGYPMGHRAVGPCGRRPDQRETQGQCPPALDRPGAAMAESPSSGEALQEPLQFFI